MKNSLKNLKEEENQGSNTVLDHLIIVVYQESIFATSLKLTHLSSLIHIYIHTDIYTKILAQWVEKKMYSITKKILKIKYFVIHYD